MGDTKGTEAGRLCWFKTVVYSLLPTLLLLGVLEGAARVAELWVPPLPVDAGQGFNEDSRLFAPKPGEPGKMALKPDKAQSFQHGEFARNKPARTLRIFALGGSSVNYLHDRFPLMAEHLRQRYKSRYDNVEIINCGGLSYGSHRLVRIADEVLGYEPDLLMLYSGHNEFEELEQLKLASPSTAPLQRAAGRSALVRFVRDRMILHTVARLERERERRLLNSSPDFERASRHEYTPEEIDSRMEKYKGNLAYMVEASRARGVSVVIGTVPSNLMKPNLIGAAGMRYNHEAGELFRLGNYAGGLAAGRALLRTLSRHQSSDAENEIIRETALRYGVPLADVEKAAAEAEPHGVPGETLFNDHCHLNSRGNDILMSVYEARIFKMLD